MTSRKLPARVVEEISAMDSFRSKVMQRRIERELDVLNEKLGMLYGDSGETTQVLDELLVQAIQFASVRPSDLWALDLKREQETDWHLQRKTVGYCAYVDKFAGSLGGIEQRIHHLQCLGVGYLHLLPFLKPGSPPNDGGFAVADFEQVDPSLGSNQDLVVLTRKLRDAGISLCADFVLNHVSNEHDWAKRARSGDTSYHGYFHFLDSQSQVDEYEATLGQVFPDTAPGNFAYLPDMHKWVWSTFYPYQWDLNYTNPRVLLGMGKSLLTLANLGVESFRLDSTGYLWKKKGTSCINLSEAHWILQIYRSLTNIACPGVLLKAEAIMPTKELPPYFGSNDMAGRECHLAYHSSLMSAAWVALSEEKAEVVEMVLDNTSELPKCGGWMTYVRCHDDIGWNVLRPELEGRGLDANKRLLAAAMFYEGAVDSSYADGKAFQVSVPGKVHGTNGMASALAGLSRARTAEDLGLAISRLHLLYAVSLFVGGIPLIYMGDEYGLLNEEWDAQHMDRGIDGRQIQRPAWNEDKASRIWMKGSTEEQIFTGIKKLIVARKKQLHHSTRLSTIQTGAKQVLAIQSGDSQLGVFNFSCQPVSVHLEGWRRNLNGLNLQDIVHDQLVADEIVLKPYGFMWLGVQA